MPKPRLFFTIFSIGYVPMLLIQCRVFSLYLTSLLNAWFTHFKSMYWIQFLDIYHRRNKLVSDAIFCSVALPKPRLFFTIVSIGYVVMLLIQCHVFSLYLTWTFNAWLIYTKSMYWIRFLIYSLEEIHWYLMPFSVLLHCQSQGYFSPILALGMSSCF